MSSFHKNRRAADISVLCLQWPLSAVGIKFANKRPYQILKDVSGVLTPVRT
jgi:hypothetical protein